MSQETKLEATASAQDPQSQMQSMIFGFWVSRAIYAAAKYALPDHLRSGPKTAEQLASLTGTHAPSLYRLLRALASIGVFHEDGDQRFHTTPLAATLETEQAGSLRHFAMAELGQEHYSAWEDFPYSLETGEIAFNHHFGKDVWAYYAEHKDHAGVFDNAMTKMTTLVTKSAIENYDFRPFRKIVDVGGGHGGLLAAMLQSAPQAGGVLFDAPQVIAGAHCIAEQGLSDRCQLVSGNFFESVPDGGDAYTLKWIIHDWNDEQCAVILQNIHRAMAPTGKVLIIDMILPEGNEPSLGKFVDLNMLVMTGGRERTAAEFKQLLAGAGFKLVRIIPLELGFGIVEGVRS